MIDIVYEDGEALVIDKPAGLPIETPRRGGPSLADHLNTDALKLGFQRPPVPVHRLDTDTSGCLLLARNPKALKRFGRAFEDRRVGKSYIAILDGLVAQDSGTIALALSKISSAEKGWRMIVAKKGKPAITHWQRIATIGQRSVIRFRPETGRTHQLRIHALAGLGAPLLGDPVYGLDRQGTSAPPEQRIRRTMLHAERLTVERDGKPPIIAQASLPADFSAFGVTLKDA